MGKKLIDVVHGTRTQDELLPYEKGSLAIVWRWIAPEDHSFLTFNVKYILNSLPPVQRHAYEDPSWAVQGPALRVPTDISGRRVPCRVANQVEDDPRKKGRSEIGGGCSAERDRRVSKAVGTRLDEARGREEGNVGAAGRIFLYCLAA